MKAQVGEKGKIFTNVVPKAPVGVEIQTIHNLIRGKYHIRPDERLTDELNQAEEFVVITEAEIYDTEGKVARRCDFLAVNRRHVIWMFQLEKTGETGGRQ